MRRQAETRERIFRAALELFANRGFQETTVEDITESADVGKGTFFNYFPSKEHVLSAFGGMQVRKVKAALEGTRAAVESFRRTLHRLMRELAVEPGRSPAFIRSVLLANLSRQPVRQILKEHLARGRSHLAEMFALGQERGEIRRDLRPIELAWLFQQLFFGVMVMWALHQPASLRERVDVAFRIFWPGVQSAAPHPARVEKGRAKL